jgi:DNA modification methylase
VRDYSRSGDLVVDPFAGWATTLIAPVGQGRHAVGAELDRGAYRKAVSAMRAGAPAQPATRSAA